MAEPLKNQYGPEIPAQIAAMIAAVYPRFETDAFLADALDGYEALELMPRGRHIATALRRHLPEAYDAAVAILVESLGVPLEQTESNGMAPFLYLPHTCFVAAYGLDHFELSMHAQYELTRRFTAEFSIRPFIERYPERTLARLETWTADPSAHVRRLVSEGTRPRLPWAPRLRAFQRDPRPVLALLERLKDDPALYVRRSVANNLNDIGKDNPDALFDTARRWMDGASPERAWVVRHALRSAVKRGDRPALDLLGYGERAEVAIRNVDLTPNPARIGDTLTLAFDLAHTGTQPQSVLVDFVVHYVKANGNTRPKVFKLKTIACTPGETVRMKKTLSLRNMTTRVHYPGLHRVEVVVNGYATPLGAFELKVS